MVTPFSAYSAKTIDPEILAALYVLSVFRYTLLFCTQIQSVEGQSYPPRVRGMGHDLLAKRRFSVTAAPHSTRAPPGFTVTELVTNSLLIS